MRHACDVVLGWCSDFAVAVATLVVAAVAVVAAAAMPAVAVAVAVPVPVPVLVSRLWARLVRHAWKRQVIAMSKVMTVVTQEFVSG